MVDSGDQRYDDLLDALGAAVAQLRRYGKGRWAAWLGADQTRIRNGDRYGIEHVLRAFGGMGSLNDLVIAPVNGDPIADDEVGPINRRLDELRDRIYDAAKAAQRETRSP